MNRFTLLFTLIALLFTHNNAISATYDVDMLNKRDDGEKMVYSEDIARVNVGDTITWVPTSKGHNVQFISVPEGVEKIKSKNNKEVSITFDTPGMLSLIHISEPTDKRQSRMPSSA